MSGHPDPHGSARYRCTQGPGLDIVAPHTTRSLVARDIEPVVWQAVECVLTDPAIIATELERRRDGTSTQQADLDRERRGYEKQLAQCEKELKRWEEAYAGEVIDLVRFKTLKVEVDARRASAEREMARLDEEQRLLEQDELETATLTDYCRRVVQNLHRFDLTEKRVALEALNITVTWHPDKPLAIQGSIPVDIVSTAPHCRVTPS
jgi:septal ring factor EnvC (AmiA/AmiB activator)